MSERLEESLVSMAMVIVLSGVVVALLQVIIPQLIPLNSVGDVKLIRAIALSVSLVSAFTFAVFAIVLREKSHYLTIAGACLLAVLFFLVT